MSSTNTPSLRLPPAFAVVICAFFLSVSTRPATAGTPAAANAPSPASLGKLIFFDTSLSSSGRMSCATCHDPAHTHAQPNALAVQSGGDALDVPGFRAVTSLRYLNFAIPFYFQKDGTPTGGLNRDGRAHGALDQASRPLLAPHEMANLTSTMLSARLSHATYAGDFRHVFGDDVFSDPDGALFRAQFAVAAFEQSAAELHPFDSKYDLFLAGKAMLTAPEMRGLALFNRSDKGNCAACHPSARGTDGTPPVFTDYTYDNLGVPRNPEIAANANTDEVPYDRRPGESPRLDPSEIQDLIAFLKTLTDGYDLATNTADPARSLAPRP